MGSESSVPRIPELDGKGPLWQQIRRAIEQPILSGAWPPGTPVPSELQLMAHYGAARMTVNRALRSLADQRLVERRRKLGTIVGMPAPERPVLEIWDIAEEIKRSGARYELVRLESEVLAAGPAQAEALKVPLGTQLLRLVCLHRSNDIPMQLEQRLIDPAAAPGALDVDFNDTPPGRWLLDHVAWTEAEHVIGAENAPENIARLLEIERGSACLVVERHTWNSGMPVTFVRLWYPSDRRRLTARFRKATG